MPAVLSQPTTCSHPLVQVMFARGLVDESQAETLCGLPQLNIDTLVGEPLHLTEESLHQCLVEEYGFEWIDLHDLQVDRELLNRFSSSLMFRHCLLPIKQTGPWAKVVTHDPLNLSMIQEVSEKTGFLIDVAIAPKKSITERLTQELGLGGATVKELLDHGSISDSTDPNWEEGGELGEQSASVASLVNELLVEAMRLEASDVHIEPTEEGLDVRFRVDGVLRTQTMPPEIHRFRSAIVSRLKIMAKLNIAEKRLPQDGRLVLNVSGRDVDIRLSSIPMVQGEGMVLRMLDKSRRTLDLNSLELPNTIQTKWKSLIHRPHGIVLVTGPTGSGKTTTLYSSLSEVAKQNHKILTIEDPVEYQIRGVNQIQVHPKIGLTFSSGLRSILRHDPDVILVGEIRDQETALSAMQASLTGHLVLSTLHTNDSASAFIRLIDMGIEPYLVSSTIEAVLAQRLVRKLCRSCAISEQVVTRSLPDGFPRSAADITTIRLPGGCRDCGGSGYSGRIGIYELLVPDSDLRRMINDSVSAFKIQAYAATREFRSLRQSGWERVIAGITSIDEVIRVTGDIYDEIPNLCNLGHPGATRDERGTA